MKIIESKANPVIKRALKAVSRNSDEPLVLVEGHKLLDEAIKSGAKPQMLFVENPEALGSRHDLNVISYQVCRTLLRELSTVQNPAEIIAFLTPPPPPNLEKSLIKARLTLVLDRLQDPGNIGTIMRTSEAMGVDLLVLLKGCCSPYNHKVIRAAMGSSFRLPVVAEVDSRVFLNMLNQQGILSACADMGGQALPAFQFPSRCAMFFGQEGQGLSKEILKECKCRLAIPMQGQVESLNVATSAAMCLYEWARTRSAD